MPIRNESYQVFDRRYDGWTVIADAEDKTFFAFEDDEIDELIEVLEESRDKRNGGGVV